LVFLDTTLNQQWDLDSIFPGGSDSPQLQQFLKTLETEISSFTIELVANDGPQDKQEVNDWLRVLQQVQDIYSRLFEVEEFVICLTCNDVTDEKAEVLYEKVNQLSASYKTLSYHFNQQLLTVPEELWLEILQLKEVQPIAFPLNEKRDNVKERLSSEQESLINDLSISGFEAWNTLYQSTVSKIKISVKQDGKYNEVTVGQAYNSLISVKSSEERKEIAESFKEACRQNADVCAAALNNIARFRITVNKYRKKTENGILTEPLENNRLSYPTLQTMWDVINKNKSRLFTFLDRKAELLGVKKLSWYDISSPLGTATNRYSYEEAAELIINCFDKFSSSLSSTAKTAFEQKWIDCEDRDTKAPGGFAARFPIAKQCRVFMNFDGSPNSVATLAHELGHVYHQTIMSNDVPPFSQDYPLSIGETASTFAETIVANETIRAANTVEQKAAMLDAKINPAITYLFGIQTRFEFEKKLYEILEKRTLTVREINELYLQSEKDAYQGKLSSYNEYWWIATRHFFFTDRAFYNFPYTFGYLFSQGIYAYALENHNSFERKYTELLRDTGRMSVEHLVLKHLGEDITSEEFWQKAIDMIMKDIEQFLEVTK
jgi:oligoendopeptidase F